ncbi:hypothetical protein DSL72_003308 [Monilinia vaccinii-corymbosi]|uniref:RING-type E3 ubiquitin transferase n=1 Tax=Monilinia vaccinii-corymbosi TaxID=61207 RepID=A0A8A3NTL9_9HELO|nr:hypothetical protein DSL72_003308 [Monilinia vaccinii-corymbosi]
MASLGESMVVDEDPDCAICLVTPVSERCGRDSERNGCKICASSVSSQAYLQPCRHRVFHSCCMKKWLKMARTCPLCRAPVEKVHHNFTGDGRSMKYRPAPQLRTLPRVRFVTRYIEDPIVKRQRVYRRQIFNIMGKPGLFIQQRLTPQIFAESFEAQSKARLFARRELEAILGIDVNNKGTFKPSIVAEILNPILDTITDMLKHMDFEKDRVVMIQFLDDYVGGGHTIVFLNELIAWMESPYDTLEQWDRNAEYIDLSRPQADEFVRSMQMPALSGSNMVSAPARAHTPRPRWSNLLFRYFGNRQPTNSALDQLFEPSPPSTPGGTPLNPIDDNPAFYS